MSHIDQKIVKECRIQLLKMKEDLLNRARVARLEFASNNKNTGDEIDQTVAELEEHSMLVKQSRLRTLLLEIEFALSRIENGQFGICEETQEPIEVERLRAIPYTRLSIEGAEIREAQERRFSRNY